jgi:UDP:flavonoid glycosyltransferase YjiC (YdhE family)
MRVLFTVNFWRGGEGNSCFQQTVPLANALRSAGHEVAYAMAEQAHADPIGAGFHAFPAGANDEFTRLQSALNAANAPEDERSRRYFRELLGGICARTMARDIVNLSRDWRPDIVVREDTEFGGCLAAEALGLPHVAVKVTGMRPPSFMRDLETLNGRRAELGLPPDIEGLMPYRHLLLVPMPEALYGGAAPRTAQFIQPLLFQDAAVRALPDWVDSLPDRPTILATSGNTFGRHPAVLRTIVEGLCAADVNVIATVGRGVNTAALGVAADNLWIEDWLPLEQMLPRCALVVCHAGPATVLSSLRNGLPLVLVPFGFDQPWNAAACVTAGVGLSVDPDARTPEAIRRAAEVVLAEPRFTLAARGVAGEIAALPGVDQAASLVEALARPGQAQPGGHRPM